MNPPVNLSAFEYVVSKITDGFLFERLGQDLTCNLVDIEFAPAGGVKDRGIDGLEYTAEQKGETSTIYQFSIEADPRSKILRTAATLKKNKVSVQRLIYVTNQRIQDQDILAEEVYKTHHINLTCRDILWLRGNVAKSSGSIRIYGDFVRDHAHLQTSAPNNLEVTDFVNDPRVFVFLRQQFDGRQQDEKLREVLVDSLILFALEGTDPDKNTFKSADEIISGINVAVKFPIDQIDALCRTQLMTLSTKKPHKINHHKNPDRYCLPFETRLKIDEQRVLDSFLQETFERESRARLSKQLKAQNLKIKNAEHILDQTFNRIFKQQGLDFANFLLNHQNADTVENVLLDTINSAIESSGVAEPNKARTAAAIQGTIREIIYQGSNNELEYLRKLSNTYMLLFLIQCDPKVCRYFDSLAAKLVVFVCNSILVPALSEIGLAKENRRHWNLLMRARDAGVKLYVNRVTLDELVGHIRKSIRHYDDYYRGQEEAYSDDSMLRYVDMMIIRAYLYEWTRKGRGTFDEFVDMFVSPNSSEARMAQELTVFLHDELGIDVIEEKALGISIDDEHLYLLQRELEGYKGSLKAKNDARTILTVYGLREKNNEGGEAGLFSYCTWWLSKDTSTHKAVMACFKDRRSVSCYLRPDFLLNYIALTSRGSQAAKVFDNMFPTLVGVSLAHHVPVEVSKAVQIVVKKHKDTSPSRRKAIISASVTELMIEGKGRSTKKLVHYLDEKLGIERS